MAHNTSVEETLSFLSSLGTKDPFYALTNVESRGDGFRSGVPYFFYHSGIFSQCQSENNEKNTGDTHSPDELMFAVCTTSDRLTPLHLTLFEFIISKVSFREPLHRKLGGEIHTRGLTNFFGTINGRKLGGLTLKQALQDLHGAQVSIYERVEGEGGDGIFRFSFPLFDHILFDLETNHYSFSLSDMTSVLFLADDLVPMDSVASLWGKNSLVSYLCNYTAVREWEDTTTSVPVGNILYEMGLLPDNKEGRVRLISEVDQYIQDRNSGAKPLMRANYKIAVEKDKDTDRLSLRRLSLRSASIKTPISISFDSFKRHILSGNTIEAYDLICSPDEDPTEAMIEKRVQERLELEIEAWKNKRNNEYVDIYDPDISSHPILLQMAVDAGFTVAEASEIFVDFCLWGQEKDFEPTKAQAIKTFKTWLESRTPASKGGGKGQRSKRVVQGENRGDATNITFNDEMRSILVEHKIPENRWENIFADFKNYYISREMVLSNWIPRFDTWVRGEVEKIANNKLRENMSTIEENFYYARIISEEVKNIIRKAGHSPMDVASGEIIFDDVTFKEFPVPPKFGRGTETLFRFKDDEVNKQILSRYTAKQSSQPILDTGHTGEIIDVDKF